MDGPTASAHRGSARTASAPKALLTVAVLGAFGVAVTHAVGASADAPQVERVRGFFCSAKQDSVDFLAEQALGENEEMAANAVNKRIAKFSCAYFLPADAIYTGDHTVMRNGVVFKLQSYVFLPEKVERWTGSMLGSLQPAADVKHDV